MRALPCTDCGQFYPRPAMEFDHVGEKHLPVGQMKSASTGALFREIAKCDVVCANCHNVRTHDRREASGSLCA